MTETMKRTDGMLRLILILFAITAVVALLLGLVNYITEDRIDEIRIERTAEAMSEVMPGGSYEFEQLGESDLNGAALSDMVTAVYAAKTGGEVGGYVVQVSPTGFAGAIDIVVGIDLDGLVTGVSIIDMNETSGLGDNAGREDFREQFLGSAGPFAVNKDGGEIDALTGATITSRAVSNGVNAARDAVARLLG